MSLITNVFNKALIISMNEEIRLLDCESTLANQIHLSKTWEGDACKSTIINQGDSCVRLKEVIMFTGEHGLKENTPMYGEGYSKLSQYGGTISEPKFFGSYNDHTHYRMPTVDGLSTVYNLLLLSPSSTEYYLMAFVSSNRFRSEFRINDKFLEIALDLEGVLLEPGQSLELEIFHWFQGADREQLMLELATQLDQHHPKLAYAQPPTGWCSWACYGPEVTELDVEVNMNAITERNLDLEFIQIDDGYQAYMGDWLTMHPDFGSDVKRICDKIKSKGLKPAIWVAPFIAEEQSTLFKEHPEWFVKDEFDRPLPSDRDSFGGWRRGPWYMLDGSHPEARDFLRKLFRTMREEWGCTYFKLDANMWGALPFGKRYDPSYTSIQAYRQGMEAILEGAGPDSFILGCNAPMWPSLGLVHGMRIANDILRTWSSFHDVAKENLRRNWQHQRIWINDPDCALFENLEREQLEPDGNIVMTKSDLTDNEFIFLATFIKATGAMVLSGDKVVEMSEKSTALLKKLLPPSGVAAKFQDSSLTIGRVELQNKEMVFLFNWEDHPITLEVQIPSSKNSRIEDFWTGEITAADQEIIQVELGKHEAKLLICS